jgi:hypothetical protein
MSPASPHTIYSTLYGGALRAAWRNATRHAWTFLLPSTLLALGVVLDAVIEPLDARWGVLASALVRGFAWGAYFHVLLRLSVGARANASELEGALLRRGRDLLTLVTPAAGTAILFLSVHTTGCLGASLLFVAGLAPVVECFLFDGRAPAAAASDALDFLRERPLSWGLAQLTLLTALGTAWLALSSAVSLGLWLCDASDLATRLMPGLVAAAVLGPLVHLALVFRGVLFLELRRFTHAQRMFRARTTA